MSIQVFTTSAKILTIFSSTFILTSIFIKPVIELGLKFEIIDKPNQRKTHSKRIVRIGGLAIFLGIITSLFIFSLIGWIDFFENKIITLTLFSTLFVFLVGFTDDVKSISPFLRLILQIIISLGIWNNLIKINYIDLSFLSIFRYL